MRGLRKTSSRSSYKTALLSIFLGCFYFASFLNSAKLAHAETKIQVIMCADTNDKKVGDMVAVDVTHIKTVFLQNVPRHLYKVYPLTGKNVTADKIASTIRSIPIDGDDVLVFVYSGHGAFETTLNEHLMTLTNGEIIRRSDLRRVVQSRGAQLEVIITNSCSNFVKFDVNSPAPNGVQRITPLFDELFLKTRGLVDISATMPGQFGRTSSAGSPFFRGLTGVIGNSQRRITWAQVVYETNELVKKDLLFDNLDQTAYPVSPLPKPGNNNAPPRQQYWLGAYARAYSGGGVEITKVVANSPASQIRDGNNTSMRLVPYRDIVTHVNGRAVNNNDQFIAAVRASGNVAKLQVYDMQTRQSGTYTAYLIPTK